MECIFFVMIERDHLVRGVYWLITTWGLVIAVHSEIRDKRYTTSRVVNMSDYIQMICYTGIYKQRKFNSSIL